MGLLREKVWPAGVGVGALALAGFALPTPVEGTKEVVQSVVNTSAIAVGFLATSLSILYSVGKSRIMEDLKASGHTSQIVNYFIESIGAWFLLSLIGGVLLLVDFKAADKIPSWGHVLLVLMCGALGWAVATLIRIIGIFRAILISPG